MARAAESAYHRIRAALLTGVYPAGERLGEVELAAAFTVSRTPVREALRRLAAEGLVEIEPNRGARVARWTADDLEEIYLLRALLESAAARRAAERIRPAAIGRLEELCAQMEKWAEPGRGQDLDQVAELNNAFHAAIVEAAASPRLGTLLAQVVQVPLVVRTFHRYDEAALTRSLGHHRELIEALRAGDGAWAESVMRSHVHAARGVLVSALRAELGATSATDERRNP
jgi:DNA-binding GntR family transcriptional regulator